MIARSVPLDGVGRRSAMKIHFSEPDARNTSASGRAARAQRCPDIVFQSIYFARMPDVEKFSS